MTYVIWIILAVAFLVIEFGTVSLVSIWFAGGSVAALIASLLGAQLWLQVVLFVVVSAALILLLRPFFKKYINPYKTKTNVDALIGQRAVVIEAIDNLAAAGAVKLDGKIWTARSADDAGIDAGTVVVVKRIEGVKAIVVPEKAQQ